MTMGRKKLTMEEKTCALTLLEQGMPGKRVAMELGVNRRSIYRLKMEAVKLPPNTTPPRKQGSGGKKTSAKTYAAVMDGFFLTSRFRMQSVLAEVFFLPPEACFRGGVVFGGSLAASIFSL